MKCPFCLSEKKLNEKMLCESEFAFAMEDEYPVSQGHTLIIPKRHVENYFDLTKDELIDMWLLVNRVKDIIEAYNHPDGYNIGVNVDKAGGQTVPHVHIHIIPRYIGDVKNPKGGIRGVIPDKQKY